MKRKENGFTLEDEMPFLVYSLYETTFSSSSCFRENFCVFSV